MRPPPCSGTVKCHATSRSIDAPGASGRGEIDAHRRAVDACASPRAPAIVSDSQPSATPLKPCRRSRSSMPSEDERRLVERVGDAVRRADVLLDEQPEVRQRVGRVVDVVDRLAPAQLVASPCRAWRRCDSRRAAASTSGPGRRTRCDTRWAWAASSGRKGELSATDARRTARPLDDASATRSAADEQARLFISSPRRRNP